MSPEVTLAVWVALTYVAYFGLDGLIRIALSGET